jgi:hypothetical protein
VGKTALYSTPVTNSALLANSVAITGTTDVQSVNPGQLTVVVMYNDSYVSNPVTSVDVDGVALTFKSAAVSGASNVSAEVWMVSCTAYDGTPTTITVHFGVGASLTIFAAAIVITQVQPNISKIDPVYNLGSNNGTVTPVAQWLAWDFPIVNTKSTVVAPAENGMFLSCVVAYKSTSAMTMSLGFGTAVVNPVDVGAATARITCAIATSTPPLTATQTISCTTNGTTAVTSAGLFGSVTAGMSISGVGIPANTVVKTVTDASNIVLTKAATDSTTNSRIFNEGSVTLWNQTVNREWVHLMLELNPTAIVTPIYPGMTPTSVF